MTQAVTSPGPIADRTFEKGFQIATLGGLAGLGILYWKGPLSIFSGIHVTITLSLFPVYLVFVAVLLGVWLGYDADETDLRPATEDFESEPSESCEYWPW